MAFSRSFRASGASLAVVAACLATAGAARADPTAADRETARGLMDEGRDLRDKGDLKEAMKRFKAADDIMHVPTTGLDLARTQVALGLLVEARDTIQSIRRTPVRPKEPTPFTEARAKADELDATLNGRVPSLTIVVSPSGGRGQPTVAIDGIELPSSVVGLPRSVDPGHHVITAKSGTDEAKQELDVREGDKKRVELALNVTSAAVSDGDEPAASTDGSDSESPAPPRSHAPDALTFVGLAVAGAGIVAGSITGVMTLSKKSTLEGECANHQCGPSSYGDVDSANTLAMVSNVSFAVAGVGAVVAIASLLIGHDADVEPAQPASSSRVRLVPWIGAGAGGLAGWF